MVCICSAYCAWSVQMVVPEFHLALVFFFFFSSRGNTLTHSPHPSTPAPTPTPSTILNYFFNNVVPVSLPVLSTSLSHFNLTEPVSPTNIHPAAYCQHNNREPRFHKHFFRDPAPSFCSVLFCPFLYTSTGKAHTSHISRHTKSGLLCHVIDILTRVSRQPS